jgi:biotin synthase
VRTDWSREEIAALFDLPFTELVFRAAAVHRDHHRAGEVQLCTLLSIKTGGCPEDCGYCSQSVKADSGVPASKLMDVQAVLQSAAQARDAGSKRFCMGAAWRNPKDRDMGAIVQMVKGVREMGMETCMTLGMLTPSQAAQLAEAGLDYYNHNIDTSPERYNEVITTRTFQDRLDTLSVVREAGINVCSGGIVGMGETRADRVGFVHALATLEQHPKACRSTRWCRSRAPCWATCWPIRRWPRSTTSNSCAPWRWRASPCRSRWCACPLAAKA